MRGVRVAVAVVSALVLMVTGYGWTAYRELGARLVTSDVLTRDRPSDGVTDILLVGLDSRTDAAGNPLPRELFDALDVGPDQGTLNTDTVILVRIPDEAGLPTTAVSIPRDSYVAIPGFGTHKINSAYARAAAAARTRLAAQGVTGPALEQQAAQAARRTLVATVEQLTGVSVDHYAEVNLAGFADITQAVGGVPVCLNAPVRDSYSGADFAAGPQTLQGPAALAFVRQRHGLPRGDLDRVVRQQAFLASLAHEVLSTGTLADPAQVSGLIAAVSRYVVVDSGWDLLAFAAQARGLTAGAISFRTIPTGRPNLPTPDDGVAVQIDPRAVRDFVGTLSEGTPVGSPRASAEGSAPPASGDDGGRAPSPPPSVAAAPAPAAQPITAAGVRCVN
jgi:LCP family protein required for cell wall assembly